MKMSGDGKATKRWWHRKIIDVSVVAIGADLYGVFLTFRWLVPAILGHNPILKGIALAVQPLSWILAAPFAFASFIALLGQFGKHGLKAESSILSRLHGKESELDRFFSESARSSKKAAPDVSGKPAEGSLGIRGT